MQHGQAEVPRRRRLREREDSVAEELQRRGYQVVHGDRELKYRGDGRTGVPVPEPASFPDDAARAAWTSAHLCWPVDRVRALVEDRTEASTFFCGGSRNWHQFVHLFDLVVVLDVDLDTRHRRLDERPGDEWADRGRDAERELAVRLHASREDLPPGSCVDASQPLARVVDEVLRLCRANG
ncbi:MAG: P-loop NTPase protein [Frankiales bacterium]|nr:P-loop NTPase protein [Frankiales bacterium]